jgi:entericidin B
MIKKFVIALSLGAMALGTTACNTVRGAGDDLESAANAVDKEV